MQSRFTELYIAFVTYYNTITCDVDSVVNYFLDPDEGRLGQILTFMCYKNIAPVLTQSGALTSIK